VRAIGRDAARHDYRFSSIVVGIVNSPPFRMKRAPRGEGGENGPATSAASR
jgi:hypothetical protein